MKLIVQVPCFNEAQSIYQVISEIPKSIEGISNIELLVIDDGSTDQTIDIIKSFGVHHIINNIGNKGLGISFAKGMNHALDLGADILVNTDGDNQYPGKFIPDLVRPIINKEADIVVGDRQTKNVAHFSFLKKMLQWIGTKVVVLFSGEKQITDAVSGFRAYSREAMLELNVTNKFSYVLDTTIQASNKRIKSVVVPIEINKPTRPSRLFNSMWGHISQSSIGMFRTFAVYKPLKLFISFGTILLLIGMVPIFRFLYDYYFLDNGSGKIQSLIIGSAFISIAFNLFALGIIGDLLGRNRMLIEEALKRLKE